MAIRKNGYVAMLDVLGFSERVARDSSVEGLDAYIDTVVHVASHYDRLGTILFSDTVAIYTFDDGELELRDILELSSRLFFSLVMAGIPIRGAIAHGPFSRSNQKAVIAGRPILDAHNYESQSQWIGIMLSPSVVAHARDLWNRTVGLQRLHRDGPLPIEHHRGIPLASGERVEGFEGFGVVPVSLAAELYNARQVQRRKAYRQGRAAPRQDAETETRLCHEIATYVDQASLQLEGMKRLAPDPRSQAKYWRAIEWLRVVARELKKPRNYTNERQAK